MKLKYFLSVPNVEEAAEYYASLLNFKIIKSNSHHAKMSLDKDVEILIHGNGSMKKKDGIVILRFSENDLPLFKEISKNLTKMNVQIDFLERAGMWGTTFTEFTDKFGYTWDLEIDTKCLESSNE